MSLHTPAPLMNVEQIFAACAAVLRDQPGLVGALNNVLPPTLQIQQLPIVVSPDPASQPVPDGRMSFADFAQLVRSRCLGPVQEILVGCLEPKIPAGQPVPLTYSIQKSYHFHHDLLSQLEDGEMCRRAPHYMKAMVRKACAPEGYDGGSLSDGSSHLHLSDCSSSRDGMIDMRDGSMHNCVTALPLNDFGTEPAYLAGKCWSDSSREREPHPDYQGHFGAQIR